MSDYELFAESFPWFFPAVAFCFGAIVGSFLNVCIYRIPVGRSIITPGSRCACGQPVAWRDNLPIISWLLLRGRARCCGRRFSARYPFIELLTGLLFLVCWLQFTPAKAVIGMLLCALLICATFIDLDHMIIPDRFSIGGAVVGVLLAFAVPALHDHGGPHFLVASLRSGLDALLGLLVGSGVVLWIALLGEIVLRKEAMGFGDVKLLGAIGAFCGWQGALFAIFGGAILGLFVCAGWILWRQLRSPAGAIRAAAGSPDPAAAEGGAPPGEVAGGSDGPAMGVPIPFGPMLAGGALLYFLWLQPWVDAYFAEVAALLALN
jgi:leader peptidase (prepilin peptidase)/N-methyltransferase